MRKVLVLTQDPVGATMGGNAIRATELARTLVPHAVVTLGAPGTAPDGLTHVSFTRDDPSPLRRPILAADVIVATPQSPVIASWIRRSRARVIYDLYDPAPLEIMEAFAGLSSLGRRVWSTIALDHYVDALHTGHHFICATERQRDLWIGAMLASRLIDARVYDADPALRSLIALVPFGVSEHPPAATGGGAVRARFDQLAAESEVVLWNGGIWNWLDPLTAVRAMARLHERRPGACLVFMGGMPAPGPQSAAARAARAEAQQLGLLGRVVLFNDSWVPYGERARWLRDADAVLSTHLDHLETRYSFRTRLLDCLWAGVPIVCTGGDELAERVAREDLGAVVAAQSPEDAADGLERVLQRGRADYTQRLAAAAADLAWPLVARPLVTLVTDEGAQRPLGADWARRIGRPAHRVRSAATRAARAAIVLRRRVQSSTRSISRQ